MRKMLAYAVCAGAVLATSAMAQDVDVDVEPEVDLEPDTVETAPDRGDDRDDVVDRDGVRDRDRAIARDDDDDDDDDRDRRERRARRDRRDPPSKVGLELQVGGGAQGFVDRDAAQVAKPGGDWTARLVVGTRSIIAAEAAYLGSAQNLDTLGVSDTAVLMSNGVEAALRLNIGTGNIQPYAIAGYAFRRYTVTNTAANFSSVGPSDNVNAIPLGAGIAFRPGRFVADLRVTYHRTFGEELIPNANLSTLSGNAKIGFEF